MAEKTTLVGGVEHRGVIAPGKARELARAYWRRERDHAELMLARSDDQLEVTYWQGARRLHPACEEVPAAGGPAHCTPLGDDRAPLLEAAELVIGSQYATAASLQRRMRVGFAEAGHLLNLLEERGVIGPAHGCQARAVLVTRADKARVLAAIDNEGA